MDGIPQFTADMKKLPNKVKAGQEVEASTVNAILDYLKEVTLNPGKGYRLNRGASGTNIDIDNPAIPFSAASHPWKVTGNGDDTVNVAAGKILSMANEASPGMSNIPVYFHLKEFIDYTGGTVEDIDADGYIYASCPQAYTTETIFEADATSGINQFDRVQPEGPVTVDFAENLPTTGSVFIFELARVTFSGGVATVTDQVMTHNPQAWSFDIPPEL